MCVCAAGVVRPGPDVVQEKHLEVQQWKHHDVTMRTTLTLDDDLAEKLKDLARLRGESFKKVVNETIRRGLTSGDKPVDRLPRFEVEPKACGFRAGVDVARLNQLTDELELEDFASELVRDATER